MEGRWASPRPSKAWFRGKCGSVCRVLFVDFWPSPWYLNDALGCRGVFEARSTLWAHRGPFGASLEVRWASPRPSKARLKGKSGGVCGVRLSYFNHNPGVPRRVPSLPYNVGTLKTFRCVFEVTLGFTATLGTPVQSKERRCRWGAPQLLSALFLVSGRCSGVPRRVPSLSHAVDTL